MPESWPLLSRGYCSGAITAVQASATSVPSGFTRATQSSMVLLPVMSMSMLTSSRKVSSPSVMANPCRDLPFQSFLSASTGSRINDWINGLLRILYPVFT